MNAKDSSRSVSLSRKIVMVLPLALLAFVAACASSTTYVREGRFEEACRASFDESDDRQRAVLQALLARWSGAVRLNVLDGRGARDLLDGDLPEGATVVEASVEEGDSPMRVGILLAAIRADGRAYAVPSTWFVTELAALLDLDVRWGEHDARRLLERVLPIGGGPRMESDLSLDCSRNCERLGVGQRLHSLMDYEAVKCDHGQRPNCHLHQMVSPQGREDAGPDVIRFALQFWKPYCGTDAFVEFPLAAGRSLGERIKSTFPDGFVPLARGTLHLGGGASWFDHCSKFGRLWPTCAPPARSPTRGR
jgi:hypothetical protein